MKEIAPPKKALRPALTAVLTCALSGCATLSADHVSDPSDPFESYNRAAFKFNDSIDRAVLKPVAQAYQFITPELVQHGVANLFGNISDIPTAVNDILQGKPRLAAVHLGRVAVNSTFGILGLFDLATPMGLTRRREDFGQTLGVWGLRSGPYLVLPILGPSSVRDTFGLAADFGLDPLLYLRDNNWRYGLIGLRAVEQRASLLGIEKTFNEISIDSYLFTRDAYLARRRSSVLDGNDPSDGSLQSSPPIPAPSAASSPAAP